LGEVRAEEVAIRGASVNLPDGWEVLERLEAVAMQSVTLRGDGALAVLAAGPSAWEGSYEAVHELAFARLNALLPTLLEDHRKARFKLGQLKAKGSKGVGTDRRGEDLPVVCGTAAAPDHTLSLCVAAPRSLKRTVVKPMLASVRAGVPGPAVDAAEHVEFQGVTLPVPAGWEFFVVTEGGLPFVHLAQQQAGFIRALQLPPAVANLPIPWEMVAGWVAEVLGGAGGEAQKSKSAETIDLGGVPAKLITFGLRTAERQGQVVFVHPLGRKDLVMFGVGRSTAFEAWFQAYLAELEIDAQAMATPVDGEGKDLFETLQDLAPGALDVIERALGGDKDQAPPPEGD
jgi:hypothetical protein